MSYKPHFQIFLFSIFFLLTFSLNAQEFFGPKWDVEVQKVVDQFGKNLAKKHQMTFLNNGVGVVVDGKQCHWDINLMANRKWNIEQARPIIVEMSQQFITLIYSDSRFRRNVEIQHQRTPKLTPLDFGIFSIGIKLAFWDENVDRPLPPYLAQIRVVDGNILYFYADPKDQSLQLPPITETIEEAFEKAGRSLMLPTCPPLSHHRSK